MSINAEDLEIAIREIAAENPDKIYKKPVIDNNPMCLYFDNQGCPSCLIGQGLYRLGLSVEDLEGSNSEGVVSLFELGIIEPSYLVSENWFENVQSAQDTGHKWSDAIAIADEAEEENQYYG